MLFIQFKADVNKRILNFRTRSLATKQNKTSSIISSFSIIQYIHHPRVIARFPFLDSIISYVASANSSFRGMIYGF